MVTKAKEVAGFYSLTNEHLGIIARRLAEKQSLHKKSEKISGVSKNKHGTTPEPLTVEFTEEIIFNLDISNGERIGRAIILAGETNIEVENFWVFHNAWSDEDVERNHFRLLRKLPKASELHLFVDECYQVLLERSADNDGLANYVRMLKNKHLSPRDFIKILLTSDEARNYVENLVIVPYPSAQLKKSSSPGINS